MKELGVKCEDKSLGKVLDIEQTENGIEITFKPTDEFYKMQNEVKEAMERVKVRIVGQ